MLNGIYDTLTPWVDTTASWTEMPRPCCLDSLVLSNQELRGEVSFIVKDWISVEGGVSAAPNSNVLIQAGQVVELDSVEFDGTTSTVEILEAPCQSCRLANPQSGSAGSRPQSAAPVPPSQSKGSISSSAFPAITSKSSARNRPYPNPFTEKLYINLATYPQGSLTISLVDQLGQVVLAYVPSEAERSNGVAVLVGEGLPSGIYSVVVWDSGRLLDVWRVCRRQGFK